jgi:hypothetical protein
MQDPNLIKEHCMYIDISQWNPFVKLIYTFNKIGKKGVWGATLGSVSKEQKIKIAQHTKKWHTFGLLYILSLNILFFWAVLGFELWDLCLLYHLSHSARPHSTYFTLFISSLFLINVKYSLVWESLQHVLNWAWWYTSVILATWEVQAEASIVWDQPGLHSMTLSQKTKKQNGLNNMCDIGYLASLSLYR